MFKVSAGTPWTIVCTDEFQKTVEHFRNVMNLALTDEGTPVVDTQFKRYAQFALPGGAVIEVVEPIETLRKLYNGIIYSITVDNVVLARKEMVQKNIEFVSPLFDDKNGWGWIYFRSPDGAIWQIQGSLTT